MAGARPAATEADIERYIRSWFDTKRGSDGLVGGKTVDQWVADARQRWRERQSATGDEVTQRHEPERVPAGTGDHFDKVRTALALASTRLAANAGNVGVAMLSACEDLKQYAGGKLKGVEDQFTGADLVKTLLGVVLGALGKGLIPNIEDAAEKFIVEQIQKAFEDKVKDAASKASGVEGTVKDLTRVVDAIIQPIRDANAIATVNAQRAFDERVAPIVEKCNRREPLAEAEDAFVGPFYAASPTQIDAELHRLFAVPGPAQRKVVQLSLYQQLVEEFERTFLLRTSSSGEKLRMAMHEGVRGADRSQTLTGRSQTAAAEAARARAQGLQVDWRELARSGTSYEEAQHLVPQGLPPQAEYEEARQEARAGL